jgi:hypothetical protein
MHVFPACLLALSSARQTLKLSNAPRADRLDDWLQEARMRFQTKAYRKRLNELKVELGVSPHGAIVPDRRSLARFRFVFAKAALAINN